MKLPKPASESTALFEKLAAEDTRLSVKKVFGNPTAFVNGNMCFGVFGSDVFFRLGDSDQKLAATIPKVRPFEPMAGRPMRGYMVIPRTILEDGTEARRWVERSVTHTQSLPAKGTKARPRSARSGG